jgi:hypothetical protein
MNNKTKFSILAVAKEKFVALRKKWGIKNKYTITDIAQKAGLPIEYLENIPANFEGFLDLHNEPRFIAVNQDLPADEQALFIARQIAFCAQQRRYNSLVLNRPWKWQALDAAPEELKNKIFLMDAEYRTHWLMLFCSTGDEFRAYIRKSPERFLAHTFTDNIVSYHLSMLKAKLWISKLYRKIAIVAFPVS